MLQLHTYFVGYIKNDKQSRSDRYRQLCPSVRRQFMKVGSLNVYRSIGERFSFQDQLHIDLFVFFSVFFSCFFLFLSGDSLPDFHIFCLFWSYIYYSYGVSTMPELSIDVYHYFECTFQYYPKNQQISFLTKFYLQPNKLAWKGFEKRSIFRPLMQQSLRVISPLQPRQGLQQY